MARGIAVPNLTGIELRGGIVEATRGIMLMAHEIAVVEVVALLAVTVTLMVL